jgi:hypothetical protein
MPDSTQRHPVKRRCGGFDRRQHRRIVENEACPHFARRIHVLFLFRQPNCGCAITQRDSLGEVSGFQIPDGMPSGNFSGNHDEIENRTEKRRKRDENACPISVY